jgi:hypothetical protein
MPASCEEEEYGRDPRETIAFVREAFARELTKPTSKLQGSFVGKRRST